jgi:asparagine synthase (glutamine-hydrolysing)
MDLPGFVRHPLWGAISAFSSGNLRRLGPLDRLRRVLNGEPVFWGGTEGFTEMHKARLLSDGFKKSLGGYSSYEVIRGFQDDFKKDAPPGADELHWMAYLDLRFRLPELLLMRVDKMTMAAGVEARVPFLDQELIRLAMSIPKSMKYKNERLKHLLKEAVEPILPPEVIHRNKQGFGLPLDQWFKESLLHWASEKVRAFARRTPYFDPAAMEAFLRTNDPMRVWFFLSLVLWHEKWIENKDLALPIN